MMVSANDLDDFLMMNNTLISIRNRKKLMNVYAFQK